MKLVATKSMRFGGRSLNVGDVFDASDKHGKLLKAIKKASDVVEPTNADADVDDRKEVAKKAAKYKRRDMRAED